MARLPIRLRLTIAFAGVIAAMLTATGVFLYAQFDRDLDDQVDSGLAARAADILVQARSAGGARTLLADSGERYAQAYARDGRVLASSRRLNSRRLLSRVEVRRAAARALVADGQLPEGGGRVRAGSARTRGGGRIVVALAEPLARSQRELDRLLELLLIALPFALLLASFAGYEVAGSALRPVERMRARAEEITEHHLAERLPLPGSEDEIGRLGATLNQMLGRLEAALARERRLVAEASHELRTPLSVLRTEVDLALKGRRDPAELRAALASVGEEVDRLSRLASDLLVLARADEGLPVSPARQDPGELLKAAAGRLRPAAEGGGRRVEADADGAPEVLADPDRVAQALDNLAVNALVHGAGTIRLTAHRAGERVELHVTDEGAGFPELFLERAFERFSRAGPAGGSDAGGSGLGLAIAAAVASAHGGGAGAANREGGGADVWIALPVAPLS